MTNYFQVKINFLRFDFCFSNHWRHGNFQIFHNRCFLCNDCFFPLKALVLYSYNYVIHNTNHFQNRFFKLGFLFCLTTNVVHCKKIFFVCVFSSCHIRVWSETTLCSYLNINEVLARNKIHIWNLSDCNKTWTHNHIVRKRMLSQTGLFSC